MTKILGVGGCLREGSHSNRLVSLTLDAAKDFGGEVKLLDLRETPLPLLNPDSPSVDSNARKAREMVLWADAFLIGTPDYHGTMSGAAKNFLDYFWHEFTGKLFATIVASHEKGLTVQDHVRTAIRQCYGWSLPYGIGFNGDADFDDQGNLTNERLGDRLRMLARDLVVYGAMLHGQFQNDLGREPRDPGFAQNFKL